jgi:hypothetical protein
MTTKKKRKPVQIVDPYRLPYGKEFKLTAWGEFLLTPAQKKAAQRIARTISKLTKKRR